MSVDSDYMPSSKPPPPTLEFLLNEDFVNKTYVGYSLKFEDFLDYFTVT